MSMFVIKRDSQKEEVSFDKVLRRIKGSSDKLAVNPTIIAQKVLSGLKDGIHTQELDELATRTAISLTTTHPDYGVLAARIAVSNHQKNINPSFSAVVNDLANQKHPVSGESYSCFNDEFVAAVAAHGTEYDEIIDHNRDFLLDYFGFKTLERGYLLKGSDGRVRERPQHLWMRVAVALWGADIDKVKETYDALSTKKFIHATPTLFNAGTVRQQLSSCYLLSMDSDSINGIFKTLGDCAVISKYAGGIGLHIHNVRAKGSIIRGTNGVSNGIVPMLRVFNNTARYVDQCFVADTEVVTQTGNKRIADIDEGDMVLTSGASEFYDEAMGRTFMGQINPTYNKVIKRVEHKYDGALLTLSLSNGKEVQMTPEHPLLSLKHSSPEMLQLLKEGHIVPDYNKPSIGDSIVSVENNEIKLVQIMQTDVKFVENATLYDLEIDGTHDYSITGMGIAHNGGGKRNGSFAIYLEPWHADIEDFLKLKLNQGAEEERARDLFYALWVPDLFMKRVEAGEDWTLFCPAEAPGLADVWGAEFEELYLRYEKEGRGKKKVSAQKLWFKALEAQIETGTPYLLYKDACNAKSNQQNLGTIKSSNLCSEIIEYSSADETAVCNLASISLPAYVKEGAKREFDFEELRKITKMITRNLNKVIDINYYPTPETLKSNMRHRPIGIGIQGLSDVFAMMRYSWESEKALELNRRIFANIYYAAIEASAEMASESGAYETFAGSPASHGKLQFDLWNVDPKYADPTLDWDGLREKAKHGLRNSLLVAPMPTASTSQILGNTEAFEPITSNIFTRRTLAGEFIIVNKYLLNDLMRYDIWNDQMKQRIIANNGSVQGIAEIPKSVQELYKTAWEIKQKVLLDMAAERGAFICQSQSLNLFVADPTFAKLTSMHFYGWKRGLKTGQYYLRSKAPVVAQKFTVDPELQRAVEESLQKQNEPQEGCLMCSG
jgi:ribonucleoside-diphosphate reductase alpha subunit